MVCVMSCLTPVLLLVPLLIAFQSLEDYLLLAQAAVCWISSIAYCAWLLRVEHGRVPRLLGFTFLFLGQSTLIALRFYVLYQEDPWGTLKRWLASGLPVLDVLAELAAETLFCNAFFGDLLYVLLMSKPAPVQPVDDDAVAAAAQPHAEAPLPGRRPSAENDDIELSVGQDRGSLAAPLLQKNVRSYTSSGASIN